MRHSEEEAVAYFKGNLNKVRNSLKKLYPFLKSGINSKTLPRGTRKGLEAALELAYQINAADVPGLVNNNVYFPLELFNDEDKHISLVNGMLNAKQDPRAYVLTPEHIRAGIDICIMYCGSVEKMGHTYLKEKFSYLSRIKAN